MGSPLPLAFAGLVIASLVLSGLELGWVGEVHRHEVGMLILVTAVPMQAVAALMSYPSRDGATAGGCGLLAAGWACTGLLNLTAAPGVTSTALGLALVAVGGLLLASVPVQAIGRVLVALVIGLAGLRFVLTAIYQLSAVRSWQHAAGIVGLVVVAAATYAVVALELEDALDRAVLPTLRRGRGRRAIAGPASAQLDGLEHEAGVRQQL
jgi:succinate-acetate transporter protein